MLALDESKNIGSLSPMIVSKDTVENGQYGLAGFSQSPEGTDHDPQMALDLERKRKASITESFDESQKIKRTSNGTWTPISSQSDSSNSSEAGDALGDAHVEIDSHDSNSTPSPLVRRNAPRSVRKKSIVQHLKSEMEAAPLVKSTPKKPAKSKAKTPVKKEVIQPTQIKTPEKTASEKTPSNKNRKNVVDLIKPDAKVDVKEPNAPNMEETKLPVVKSEPLNQDDSAKPKTPRAKRINAVSPPKFRKVQSPYPTKVIWAKLAVRDFIVRFEKFGRVPTRYNNSLNDPTVEWDGRMYKSIIVICIRIMYNDRTETPVITFDLLSDYLTAIEKTVGDIGRIFLLLDEMLVYGKILSKSIFDETEDDDEFEKEYQHLSLLTILIGITNQTETLRQALVNIPEHIKESGKKLSQEIEKAEEAFDKILAKIRLARKEVSNSPPMYAQPKKGSEPRKTKKEQLADLMVREVTARNARNNKIQRAKEMYNFRLRRHTPRTMPLGTDYFGNTYWHFQQRSIDSKEWGWWIVVEANSLMPNSLQQSVPKKEESAEEEQHNLTPTKQTPVKRKRVTSIAAQGTGELYFLPIEKHELEKALSWLEYQEKLFNANKNGGRKHKNLCTGIDADRSAPNIVRYLKQLLPMSENAEENGSS